MKLKQQQEGDLVRRAGSRQERSGPSERRKSGKQKPWLQDVVGIAFCANEVESQTGMQACSHAAVMQQQK